MKYVREYLDEKTDMGLIAGHYIEFTSTRGRFNLVIGRINPKIWRRVIKKELNRHLYIGFTDIIPLGHPKDAGYFDIQMEVTVRPE